MRRWIELLLLIVSDAVAAVLAFGMAVLAKYYVTPGELSLWVAVAESGGAFIIEVLQAFLLLSIPWVGILAYAGLYGEWSTRSRVDELVWLVKVVFFCAVLLFLLTFSLDDPLPVSRVALLSFGVSLVVFSGIGRMCIRGLQRYLFSKGHNLKNALLVGTGKRAHDLSRTLIRFPRLGYRLVGFAAANGDDPGEQGEGPAPSEPSEGKPPVLGHLNDLPELVEKHDVRSVIFADSSLSHEDVLTVVAQCPARGVAFNVVPDIYDVIVGRSSGLGQLYGVPMMPLFPDTMPVWERRTKRLLDIFVALTGIIVGLPLWLFVIALIWLEDHGPIIYSQERTGREGRNFKVHKFRSMVPDAESRSGPVWASQNDDRITRVGHVIRKVRIDEVPQLWNVLKGEMSMVGPRPERPFFVKKLADEIPLYRLRLHVKPGVTGWAQTKQAYDSSVDDVREKLKYDLYYIENMSLRFDILILLRTVWVVLAGKGAQ